MKKLLTSVASATALLGAVAAPAFAASTFHLVVPLNARPLTQEPAEIISVSLAGAALPKAGLSVGYSESLHPYLSVTGDSALDKAAARWSLVDGALPGGLALDEATGAVSGTPTAKTTSPASFTVLATYKGKDGQAVYTIEVGAALLKIKQLATGGQHTCAITVDDLVKCWGRNKYGQLGNGTVIDSRTPVSVPGVAGAKSIAAGGMSTCVILTDGSAKCWGYNASGQLGDGSVANKLSPTPVIRASNIRSIALGDHACAIIADGTVKCWGANAAGQVGDTSQLTGVVDIALGSQHTCAVTSGGEVKCWGYDAYGQLGNGRDLSNGTVTSRSVPITVANVAGATAVTAGSSHTCAVVSGGKVACWGFNNQSQLGYYGANSSSAKEVAGLSGAVEVSAGVEHSCASLSNGAVACWGRGSEGQLGIGTLTNATSPVTPTGVSAAISLSSGSYFTCATASDGTAKCWGDNWYGQLANTGTSAPSPVEVLASP